MTLIESKLYIFVTTCFWHYCLILGIALIWFIVSKGGKSRLLNLTVVGFLFVFALRMLLRLNSSRYMFNLVLLAFPIIACAGVALYDRCRRSRRLIFLFILIVAVTAVCSSLKFARKSRNPRDGVILGSAEMIRKDFAAVKAREALLVSNGDNIGMTFIYSGIPGKFYTIEFSPAAPQKFESQLQLLCSQYPLVYLQKERRLKKREFASDKIFDCALTAPHSYHVERIDGGKLDPGEKYGRFELFRIDSRCAEEYEKTKIDDFVRRPPRVLKNGGLAIWKATKTLSPDPQFGNRFLAGNTRPPLPDGWTIDFNNRRAADFSNWSFRRETSGAEGRGRWRVEAPEGGFALKSRQFVPVGDYSLKIAVDATQGCRILFFLYGYGPNREFLFHQNAGVWQSRKSGRVLLTVPIKKDSFPVGTAFFGIGVIGWQGVYAIEKMDVSEKHTEHRNE